MQPADVALYPAAYRGAEHAGGAPADATAPAGKHEAAQRLAELDKHCEAAYEHLVREALDGSLTLHMRSFVQGQHLLMVMSGTPQGDAATPAPEASWPFTVTNDVDLATLISTVRGEMQDSGSG